MNKVRLETYRFPKSVEVWGDRGKPTEVHIDAGAGRGILIVSLNPTDKSGTVQRIAASARATERIVLRLAEITGKSREEIVAEYLGGHNATNPIQA